MYAYKDGEKVKFEYGVLQGEGIIKGAALGGCYIIEVTSCAIPLPSGVYPYRTISMSELFISKVEHE